MKICLAKPKQPVPESYFECRYRTLREPLGFVRGDEKLEDDEEAIHAWIEENGEVIAVGRVHLIPNDSNGAQADSLADGAAICPAFNPLDGKEGFPNPIELRPAVQIRQMGVEVAHRRRGLGRLIIDALEVEAMRFWSARSGWLQARSDAIAFYAATDWEAFGENYHILRIGEHRSMWKEFSKAMS